VVDAWCRRCPERLCGELGGCLVCGGVGGGGGLASFRKETSTEYGWKVLVRNGTHCDNTGRAP
jgi:hypothetical protein